MLDDRLSQQNYFECNRQSGSNLSVEWLGSIGHHLEVRGSRFRRNSHRPAPIRNHVRLIIINESTSHVPDRMSGRDFSSSVGRYQARRIRVPQRLRTPKLQTNLLSGDIDFRIRAVELAYKSLAAVDCMSQSGIQARLHEDYSEKARHCARPKSSPHRFGRIAPSATALKTSAAYDESRRSQVSWATLLLNSAGTLKINVDVTAFTRQSSC